MGRADLRTRLARFDRPVTPARPPAGDGREPMPATRAALGLEVVGEGPAAYLRRDLAVPRELWPGPPHAVVDGEAWRRLGGVGDPGPAPWAILDTETTGLEGGAGTLVFLVGVLLWDATGARLRQYLLPEPAGEGRLLADLWEDLRTVGALVSYNGRAFDCSRLRSRAVLNRLETSCLDGPHLDLVTPARRLARGWLADARLASLEAGLLGRARSADLAGSLVPAVYRAWLVEGREDGLTAVLDHNRMDVENLLELARILARVYGDGEDPLELPAAAHLAVGRALAARGRHEAARERFGRAARADEASVARRALWELAHSLRRARRYDEAAARFEEAVRRWPHWVRPRVEVAKILEHRRRDFDGALAAVRGALDALRRGEELGGEARPGQRRALRHRAERLRRRRKGGRGEPWIT